MARHILAGVAIIAAFGSITSTAQDTVRPAQPAAGGAVPPLVFSVMPEYPLVARSATLSGTGINRRSAKVDEAQLYRTFVDAGFFDGLAARRPLTSSLAVSSTGIDITVLAELPRVDVVTTHVPVGPKTFDSGWPPELRTFS